LNRAASKDAKVFRARPLFAANMIGAFWLGLIGYFAMLVFQLDELSEDKTIFALLLASGIAGLLIAVPGRLFSMWPYAVALEPQKGIWIYARPKKLWIPLEEIVDIDVYSGAYGAGHAIQLNRSHGLVKQIRTISLFFPDENLVRELRAALDRRDGVVYSN
jgi:hypothetical protein